MSTRISTISAFKRRKSCINTESVVMRASTGTVRWVRGEHRHEPFAVAAADLLVTAREAFAGIVEQSGGAGGTRRVEREDHGRIVVTSGGKPQPPKK